MKLLKLELNAFRGATRPFVLDFDPARRLTMIFGENGAGKSSISDALICLCTNDTGSLDDKSGADKAHLLATGCASADLYVRLHTDQGLFAARLAGKKINKNHTPDPPPTLRHLRRSSVVALSTAAPAARYEQLAEYFDLSGIVKSEQALRTLVKSLKDESDRIIRTLSEVERILEEVWRSEGSPSRDWQAWAGTEMRKDLHAETKRLHTLRALLASGQRALQTAERLQNARENGELAAQKRREAEARLADLQQNAGFDAELLQLLQQARTFVAAHTQDDACPLCAQTVHQTALLASLDGRLDNMATLRELADHANAARAAHERFQTLWQGTLDELNADLDQWIEQATYPGNPPAIAQCLAEIKEGSPSPRQRAERFQNLKTKISPLLDGQQVIADAISKTLDQHQIIQKNWQSVQDNRRLAEQNEQILHAAEQALALTELTRKAFIDAELTAISAAVDSLYQSLHPNEALGDIRLFLKEKGKSSLELTARFHGHTDITPQSLYSESHLDTLALCIFFALAKRYGGASTILLLDDVVSACDEIHLDRFVTLLHDQAPHFAHVIVTTHYRLWRDRYRQQRAPNEVHFIDLKPWSLHAGIGYRKIQTDLEDLEKALNQNHRRETAACSGIILENILDYLTMRYGCRLRRNPKHVYTLGELLDAVLAKLAPAFQVEHFAKDATGALSRTHGPTPLKPLLHELKRLTDMRNTVGAHYNPAGAEASDPDVQLLGEKTLELVRLLCCPIDGSLPNKEDSGSYLETRKGTVRLHPLREPA